MIRVPMLTDSMALIRCWKGKDSMYQTIAITLVALRRLLNYQRVCQNRMKAANKRQWIDMTRGNMLQSEAEKQKSERTCAVAAYAGFLYRVQNQMMPYRALPNEYLLHNALVQLMEELKIPIHMVDVESSDRDASRADSIKEEVTQSHVKEHPLGNRRRCNSPSDLHVL